MAKKEHNISADIIIKFLNADEGGNVSNNKCKQPSIIVVIPLNVTKVAVSGCIKTKKNRINQHYKISVQQNIPPLYKNSNPEKLLQILSVFIKTIFLELINKIKDILYQDVFESAFNKIVKIFLIIRYLLKWWDYLLYVFEHLNFDWVGGEYIANIFEHFL